MSDKISIEDAAAVKDIIVKYAYLVDHGRISECATFYTDDASIIFGPGSPKPAVFEGTEAIRGFLASRQSLTNVTSRHVMSNFYLEAEQGGRILAHSVLTLFRSFDEGRDPIVSFVADIDEIYVRAPDGGMRIQRRQITPVFFPKT